MSTTPNIAEMAALIADPSRSAMLLALLGGQTLLASELALQARITPQTASTHLAKLVEGRLLTVQARGRHRYFRLSSAEVAHVLESLITIAPPVKVRSLRQSDQTKALHCARTCYDHIAGEVGVAVAETMVQRQWLVLGEKEFTVTAAGRVGLLALGIDVAGLSLGRRPLAKPCLDWSERRYHVAGVLGASLAELFFSRGWIVRLPATRAIRVTNLGTAGFGQYFYLPSEKLNRCRLEPHPSNG